MRHIRASEPTNGNTGKGAIRRATMPLVVCSTRGHSEGTLAPPELAHKSYRCAFPRPSWACRVGLRIASTAVSQVASRAGVLSAIRATMPGATRATALGTSTAAAEKAQEMGPAVPLTLGTTVMGLGCGASTAHLEPCRPTPLRRDESAPFGGTSEDGAARSVIPVEYFYE